MPEKDYGRRSLRRTAGDGDRGISVDSSDCGRHPPCSTGARACLNRPPAGFRLSATEDGGHPGDAVIAAAVLATVTSAAPRESDAYAAGLPGSAAVCRGESCVTAAHAGWRLPVWFGLP